MMGMSRAHLPMMEIHTLSPIGMAVASRQELPHRAILTARDFPAINATRP